MYLTKQKATPKDGFQAYVDKEMILLFYSFDTTTQLSGGIWLDVFICR